jgi:ketosteroid isomerase-like protein
VIYLGSGDLMSNEQNGERERLLQTSRDWAAATAGGDFERALAYWTDDAMVLPPDQPAVVGKEEIRAFVQHAASNPGFSISWEPELVEVSDSGDMGYMVERNRVTFTDASGSLQTHHGKAVTIWRKQPDGTWKCVVDTWNGNPRVTVFEDHQISR